MENQITIEDMKSQSKALRGYLNDQGLNLSHSKSLEAVARSRGFKDWNTASALVLQMEKFWEDEYEKLKARGPERWEEEYEGYYGKFTNRRSTDLSLDGKEVFTGIYASKRMLVYVGWAPLGHSIKVSGHSSAILTIVPTVTPYFEPKAIRLIGSEVTRPSVNRRFIVGAVEVGGSPMLCVHRLRPKSFEEGLISDVFSRSYDPLLVNWSVLLDRRPGPRAADSRLQSE